MDAKEILEQARDTLTVRRVFGEPIERGSQVVVPVASIRGGAGGGSGEGEQGEGRKGSGFGGGWGVAVKPAGVYVITDDTVSWQPALDLNRLILGGQIAFIIGLLVLRSVIRARRRR